MAADKTVASAAHIDLTQNTAYTLNVTGPGKYIDVVCHSTGSNDDVYFAIASTEAGLPVVTLKGDNLQMVHSSERLRLPSGRNTWIRFISSGNKSVSVVKMTTIY